MHERIHRHLDGELALEELTDQERAELEAYQALIRHAASLREKEAVPDMTGSVMARIAEREAQAPSRAPAERAPGLQRAPGLLSALEGLVRWVWEPRPIRLRPAYAIAAAAALLVLTLVVPGETPVTDVATEGAAEQTQVFVQFRLDAPEASNVRLAGSFTGWEADYSLHQTAPGVWTILVPLSPGIHDYAFVVDGREWRPDPVAPRVDDGFGGENSRVAVLSPTFNSL